MKTKKAQIVIEFEVPAGTAPEALEQEVQMVVDFVSRWRANVEGQAIH